MLISLSHTVEDAIIARRELAARNQGREANPKSNRDHGLDGDSRHGLSQFKLQIKSIQGRQ